MRILELLGLKKRSRTLRDFDNFVSRPVRGVSETVTTDAAISLSSVYRAVSILSGTVAQLPLYVERDGKRLPPEQTPGIIRTPYLDYSRGDFIETLVTSLALHGNAYFLAEGEYRGAPAQLRPLNPLYVSVGYDDRTRQPIYHFAGKKFTRERMGHVKLLTMPGQLTGVGPIQAAQSDLAGALKTRDYASQYFDSTGQPSAIISTDAALTQEEARAIIAAYNHVDPETGKPLDPAKNRARVKVFGNGVKYTPLQISARDAQWIEARQFDTTTIARLFGVPASLMLAAVEGTSMTYANVEQEWISFARFTLTQYTRKIEDELTRMTVRGQRVKFNFEGLLRSDTLTRYQAHAIALEKGFQTVNEVRALEDLDPLPQDTP